MPTRDIEKLLLQNADRVEATTADYEKILAKRYRDAYKEIEAQLADLYAKMGDTPSLAEARRYGRLDSVRKAIAEEYRKLTRKSILEIRDNSAASFANAFYGSAWAYDQAVGVEVRWPVLPVDAIRASVWSGATGENFSARLRQWNTRELITLQNKITSGLARGFGYAKMAREVKREVSDDYSRIVRIVRTEAHRNYNQGHLELYNSLDSVGVEARKKWVASLDTRTRDTHGRLDGDLADEKGLFYSSGLSVEAPGLFGDPAEDINCRCRIVEEIDGLSPELRRVRGEGIVPYQTFDTWASARGWSRDTGWDIQAKVKLAEDQARKY